MIILLTAVTGYNNEPGNIAISVDGVKVSFNQMGKGKPAIVFIHGWPNKASIWDEIMSYFSAKYRTVAIDLYGSDESHKNRNDWSMKMFGEDVAAVIKKLKLRKVVLVGFSMGGLVVIETAKLIPEKITGLVLVDTLQDVEAKYPPEMITVMESYMMDIVTNPTNEKYVTGGYYKKNQEDTFKRMEGMTKNSSQTGWKKSLHKALQWLDEDCTMALEQIKVPVTAINSDQEPTKVEVFQKYVLSFKARIVPGVGHFLFWDNPEEFNRLLEESIQEFESVTK